MLTFWATASALALLVLLVLSRPARALKPAARDIDVYRDQLAEADRDLARGIVSPDEAIRLRTEIGRRILAVDRIDTPATRPTKARPPLVIMSLLVAALPAFLYINLGAPGHGDLALADRIAWAEKMRQNRPDQASAEATLPPAEMADTISDEDRVLLTRLRDAVSSRADDLTGLGLLAQTEARIGNFAAAARAQATIVRIKGSDTSVEELAELGQLNVLAAGGYVSPEAELALRTALARDASNGTARYYLGLMMVQTGRPDLGFRIWDRQLREGPETAPWIAPITGQIIQVARAAGVDYDMPAIGPGTAGPSADDIAAADDMTPAARMEMIGGMVAGLSDRLAREGGPPRDWARLITSLGVLGDTDRAAAIYENAIEVFGDDPAARDIITRAGEQAGVAG